MLNAVFSGVFIALALGCLFAGWVYSLLATSHSRWFFGFSIFFSVLATCGLVSAARAQSDDCPYGSYGQSSDCARAALTRPHVASTEKKIENPKNQRE